MALKFELVAGPYSGSTGGLAWDGKHMLFSAVQEERIYKYDPSSGKVSDFRKYTGRTNGIAIGPNGSVFGAQEGGRRVIEFKADGSTDQRLLDGSSQPARPTVALHKARVVLRCLSCDTAYVPPVYPFPDCTVLRLDLKAPVEFLGASRPTLRTRARSALAG